MQSCCHHTARSAASLGKAEFTKAVYEYLLHLLERGQIYALELVFAELLQGAKTDREREKILDYWNNVPRLESKNIAIDAGLDSGIGDWTNKRVSLIDAIIISYAQRSGESLWTLDKKLHKILRSKQIYEPFLG